MYVQLDSPPRLPPLKLDSVALLMDYLDSLSQNCIDRDLTWKEDTTACYWLQQVPLPESETHLKELVAYYVQPVYRQNRTLGVWYAIARSVARMIQEGQSCDC